MEENRKLDYLPEAFDIQRESDNHDFYDKIYDEEWNIFIIIFNKKFNLKKIIDVNSIY